MNIAAIIESVHELGEFGLIPKADVQARVHGSAPLFKLYLVNNEELFFGFYPVREHTVTIDGQHVSIFDPMGKDAVLFHHTADADETSMASQYVSEARTWFDSVWNSVARSYTP